MILWKLGTCIFKVPARQRIITLGREALPKGEGSVQSPSLYQIDDFYAKNIIDLF
jgi:hypothetical protein